MLTFLSYDRNLGQPSQWTTADNNYVYQLDRKHGGELSGRVEQDQARPDCTLDYARGLARSSHDATKPGHKSMTVLFAMERWASIGVHEMICQEHIYRGSVTSPHPSVRETDSSLHEEINYSYFSFFCVSL